MADERKYVLKHSDTLADLSAIETWLNENHPGDVYRCVHVQVSADERVMAIWERMSNAELFVASDPDTVTMTGDQLAQSFRRVRETALRFERRKGLRG